MDDKQLGHINGMQEPCQINGMQESCQTPALRADGKKKQSKLKPHKKRAKTATHSEVGTILALRAQGLEAQEIAQEMGKPESQVKHALRQIGWLQELAKDTVGLKDYRERQVDILELLQTKILGLLLTKLKNGEGTLRELTYCFKELFTASRLIQGKVTQLTGELRFTAPPELAQALTERLSCVDITDIDNNSDKDAEGVPFD